MMMSESKEKFSGFERKGFDHVISDVTLVPVAYIIDRFDSYWRYFVV